MPESFYKEMDKMFEDLGINPDDTSDVEKLNYPPLNYCVI